MSAERVIALLGRRDEPTDAVEEYCNLLGAALAEHSFHVEVRRVPWREHGWPAALDALRLQADAWRGTWVLVQYTSLAWSSRGFPTRFLRVLRVLRKAGCRIAVVFHDAEPFGGTRLVDRVRRAAQLHVMRSAVAFADRSILTVPVARLGWVHGAPDNAFFIPVGANLPQPLLEQDHDELHDPPTVAVYGVTGGSPGDWETRLIASSVREAATKLGKLRLVCLLQLLQLFFQLLAILSQSRTRHPQKAGDNQSKHPLHGKPASEVFYNAIDHLSSLT